MNNQRPPSLPISEAMHKIGSIIGAHLYSSPGAPKCFTNEKTSYRIMDRKCLAAILDTSYAVVSQWLAGRQAPSPQQWQKLMTGRGGRPVLAFGPDRVAELQAAWAVLAGRKGYRGEGVRAVLVRWLGWIEEGDQLSLDMLKAEMVEKFKHLRQPSL